MKTADCAAVVLTSSDSDWIAFVHVGFNNLITGVLKYTMDRLLTLGNYWNAVVTRHIHKESYIHTNPEIFNLAKLHGLEKIVEKIGNNYHLDLTKGIELQLGEYVRNIDFDKQDNFKLALEGKSFSHRAFQLGKTSHNGRLMVAAWKD